MASGTRKQLEQAYSLIQQEDLEGALTILRPIVTVQPDNAEAWWLIANAVSEPVDAYEALDNVVRLNPGNQEAKEQLDNLLEQFPDVASHAAPTMSMDAADSMDSFSVDDLLGDSPATGSAASVPVPEDYDSMFGNEPAGDDSALDLDSFFGSAPGAQAGGDDDKALDAFFTGATVPSKAEAKPEKKGRGRGKAPKQEESFVEPSFMDDDQALAETADKGKGKEKKPKPTKIEAPKEERVVDALEIERRANRRPNRSVVFLLLAAIIVLAGGAFVVFVLPNIGKTPPVPAPVAAALQSVETALKTNNFNGVKADLVGDAFQATICDKAGPGLQDNVVKAMDLLAKEAASVKDLVKTAGLLIVNCTKTEVTILHEVVPIDAVVSYVTGNMSNKRDFRASWKKQ